MDAEPTGDFRPPVPDPTLLTTAQLIRSVEAERDYTNGQLDVLRERLHGIDTATKLLNETVNRVPTALQEAITHLRELDEEKFRSIHHQFGERDVRSERESRDNKVAVDAAFAAQKEAAAQAEVSNAKAIDKSEIATAETIKTLTELFRTTTDAHADKVDDLKLRVASIEANKVGSHETEAARHQSTTSTTQMLMVLVGVLAIVVTIALATHGFTK